MSFVPMGIVSLRPIIERTYTHGEPLQFLRELVANSLEAGATKILIGPQLPDGESAPVWRFVAKDNGRGMSGDQMRSYLNNFGHGGKAIGGAHENFGIGSKTSLLPWNRAGMVVISYTEENQQGSMIRLRLDEEAGEYGLSELKSGSVVCEPFDDGDVDWASLRPDWMFTGTIIVLMGNTGTESTFLEVCETATVPKLEHKSKRWAINYLATRYWQVKQGTEIRVQSFNGDATSLNGRDWNIESRRLLGGKVNAENRSVAHGRICLPDGTDVWWYLKKGESGSSSLNGIRSGGVAALYNSELYEVRTHHNTLKKFGLVGKTRSRTVLIFEPKPLEQGVGVCPNAARSHLIMKSPDQFSSVGLPWDLWSDWFRERLPDEIIESMVSDQADNTAPLDESWAERLKAAYGSRWTITKPVRSLKGDESELGEADAPVDSGGQGRGLPDPTEQEVDQEDSERDEQLSLADLGKNKRRSRRKALKGGVPEAIWVEEDWAPSNSIAASYTKPSKAHPAGLVELNWNHRIFTEVFEFWCSQYQDQAHIQKHIKNTIMSVYKRHSQTTIAHAHSFEKSFKLDELLSDVSLTCSLMGIYAQDHEIMLALSKVIAGQSRVAA